MSNSYVYFAFGALSMVVFSALRKGVFGERHIDVYSGENFRVYNGSLYDSAVLAMSDERKTYISIRPIVASKFDFPRISRQ